tara:strand:+ start:3997 stop:4155 length:159 start_codon:yes stop_codon:yes gene_type:complete
MTIGEKKILGYGSNKGIISPEQINDAQEEYEKSFSHKPGPHYSIKSLLRASY